ncbi:Uncharacterised protein [Yersinia pseudotuberculosis]|nr:hypothetical protein BZ19_2765 [Yersinia pseudotuberculosis str. PA3606]UFA60265.1 Uncharacterized protein YP598_0638 [Yersinia pseudotuberculosis]CFV34091.1 Uncharacterised protein [Yersinia pseudotuberculosis]CNG53478.1 Uncharacterised protein [Yersinia pseudotuberculosis]CNI19802.1 Uncharacterised protein [Yersinia pseudotuberculosis]
MSSILKDYYLDKALLIHTKVMVMYLSAHGIVTSSL